MAAGETEKLVESLGEDALDAGITSVEEAASTESLENIGEAAGIGIFLAVGVDVIFAAINGAKERDALQGILDKLDAKMTIVNKYLTTVQGKRTEIDGKTIDRISTFQKVASEMINLLPAGHKPTFSTDFPPTLESLDKCLADQQLAITQFSLLIQLRNTYVKALKRNPNVTKDTVINAVLLTAPDWVTYDMLESIWTQVLAKYSNLIANAS